VLRPTWYLLARVGGECEIQRGAELETDTLREVQHIDKETMRFRREV